MTMHASADAARVAILSRGGGFCEALLRGLAARDLRVDALVVYPPEAPAHQPAGVRARLRGALGRPVRAVRDRARQVRLLRGAGGVAPRRLLTGPLNSTRMERDLRRLDPEWVVVAHTGMIAPPVLAAARGGFLNVHPGLLPWIRGSNPLANSLLRGVALGATAFRLDPGIDTGRLIERRLLEVSGDEGFDALRDALHHLWVEMTADLVAAALRGEVPEGVPQGVRYPLCRTVDAAQRLAADEAVRAGQARTLYERWLADPELLSLAGPVDAASSA